jgi:hypothetical protein
MPDVSEMILLLAGFVLGWLVSPVQARWKGVHSLKGSLRALEDSILNVEYCLGTSSDKVPFAQLEADLERFRAVLIEHPRLGEEYWIVYKKVFELSLAPANFKGEFLQDTFNQVQLLQKRSRWRIFFRS